MHTTTASVFEQVRAEHAALRPHVEAIRIAAEDVALPSGHDAFEFIDESWRFLSSRLLDHAAEEERTIYVSLSDTLGSPEAAQLLTMDHEAIIRLVDELTVLRRAAADHDHLPEDLIRDLRRVLYGLYALISAHLAKEEAIVVQTFGP